MLQRASAVSRTLYVPDGQSLYHIESSACSSQPIICRLWFADMPTALRTHQCVLHYTSPCSLRVLLFQRSNMDHYDPVTQYPSGQRCRPNCCPRRRVLFDVLVSTWSSTSMVPATNRSPPARQVPATGSCDRLHSPWPACGPGSPASDPRVRRCTVYLRNDL